MRIQLLTLVFISAILSSSTVPVNSWIKERHKAYDLFYMPADKNYAEDYNKLVKKGIAAVKLFFNSSYRGRFDIYVHPDRRSLDSTWQKDWKDPGFRSECWMVASGVAARLDMISPKKWNSESCEHRYEDTGQTQQLITHELVHVYHGQLNASPDFNNTDGIDWFVEGLATYASGQYNTARAAEVKKAVADHSIPKDLDHFWTGKLRYGLSGSVVMYIDHLYGRDKLKELLPVTKKDELFSILHTTETELLAGWEKYIAGLPG